MASTYDNNLRLREMGTGDESGTWGIRTNENLELIGEALGYGTEAVSGTTHTTTIADGATDPGRAMYLKYTGALGANCTITLAPNTISKLWFIENATTDSGSSGPYSIIISQGSGANVTIPNGKTKLVYTDGVGSGAAVFDGLDKIDIGANSTRNGSSFSDVTADSVTTFTNKTFDADATGNSLTNVEDANIKSGAAIDAAKIANGNVSNTEFQHLNGVSSAIQTQLDAKLNVSLPLTDLNSTDGQRRFRFDSASHTYIDSAASILLQSGNATKATLDSSGNFTATGNVGAYSDVALKEDIYQIENALDKVKKLRGVHFTKKSNKSKEIGVVANEVEKVVPELVDEHEDKELGTVKTMKYANTVGLLIEAVKDLSKQVEELKNDSSN